MNAIRPISIRVAARWLLLPIAALALPRLADARASTIPFVSIEAARSDWSAQRPPASGWQRVTLPDDWSARWPAHDGVVWYRLTWRQRDADRPVGLAIDYWTLAGAAYLNGTPIARDPQLIEPLSRSWNLPRHWLLARPLLRAGTNVLVVRVSGHAAYQPGLGSVLIGEPRTIRAHFEDEYGVRRSVPRFNLGISAALATLFLAIWLMRRRETAFGWYGLALAAWAGYSLNLVVTSPWPFTTSDGWSRTMLALLLLFVASHAMFVLRFLDRRHPRIERLFYAGVGAGMIGILATPHDHIDVARALVSVAAFTVYLAAVALLLASTWRSRRIDHWGLNLTNLLMLAAAAHDLLAFNGILKGNFFYTPVTSMVLIVGMAIVLAWKFVSATSRVERFNDELTETVEAARAQLKQMLDREHALRIESTRLAERMNLAHNLHDGMGATLVNSIAAIEHDRRAQSPARFLSILKDLREELRLIIDTSTGARPAEQPLADWLAPLRARITLLCESRDIRCRWVVEGLDGCTLPAAQSLDLTRIVQEALTNALKHGGASEIEMILRRHDGVLSLSIRDDGGGFDRRSRRGRGIGLTSMAARATRLGGALDIRSGPEGTAITLDIAAPAEGPST